jgi:hypothetical protein
LAGWEDVSRLALALPEAEEGATYGGNRAWTVRKKMFIWERPLRRSDLKALGDAAPQGPILGAKVEHLIAKEALLADDPAVFFTTPHFDGYPAVLIRLPAISNEILEEVIAEAWLSQAPKRLARHYLDGLSGSQAGDADRK